jgi:hypothetical protein
MGTESVASLIPYATAIPILLAVCGGISTAKLGRAAVHREAERGLFRAFSKAIHQRHWRTTRDFTVAGFNLLAMVTVGLTVAWIWHGDATPPEAWALLLATIFQGGIALMAFSYGRETISGRPEQSRKLGDFDSWNQSGGCVVSSSTAENEPMSRKQPLTRQERAQFVELGLKRYESLRTELERTHLGEYVAISIKTGKYTTTEDDAKLKEFADKLGPDDFLWMTRVRA